jgi:hypothetical protein
LTSPLSLLRCIVFVGEAALGAGFDLKRVSLGAMNSGYAAIRCAR